MTASFDFQLLLALAIVALAVVAFGYSIWHRVAAVGFTRDDFDRRAPWLALGIIIGGAVLYYVRH